MFSDTCKIDTKFLSLNYLGSYVEPQPSKGCVLSGPDKDGETHIIELQAPNSSRWASKAKKTCHHILCWGQDALVDLCRVCWGWKQHEGGCRWNTVHFWDFFFFDKHISELIVKVQLCQTVFSLPQLSDYSVHPEGYRSGKSWDSRCALSHSTAVGVYCLSRNTSSILMSWTDTRGTVPSPDLNLSKWFFHFFLQCFPSGCYSGTTADGGWCPPASWRCFGAKVCQICQLGHQGTQCSWQASYSGKTATQLTSHCSSEEKKKRKLGTSECLLLPLPHCRRRWG